MSLRGGRSNGGTTNLEVIADWEYDNSGKAHHTIDPEGRKRKQGNLLLLPSGRQIYVPYVNNLVSRLVNGWIETSSLQATCDNKPGPKP